MRRDSRKTLAKCWSSCGCCSSLADGSSVIDECASREITKRNANEHVKTLKNAKAVMLNRLVATTG